MIIQHLSPDHKSFMAELLEKHSGHAFHVSAITVKELHVGLGYTRFKQGVHAYNKKKHAMVSILDDFHVIEVSKEVLIHSGLREGELQAKGTPVDIEDIIIGVTAELLGATAIITRNPRHYAGFSIPVEAYAVSST